MTPGPSQNTRPVFRRSTPHIQYSDRPLAELRQESFEEGDLEVQRLSGHSRGVGWLTPVRARNCLVCSHWFFIHHINTMELRPSRNPRWQAKNAWEFTNVRCASDLLGPNGQLCSEVRAAAGRIRAN